MSIPPDTSSDDLQLLANLFSRTELIRYKMMLNLGEIPYLVRNEPGFSSIGAFSPAMGPAKIYVPAEWLETARQYVSAQSAEEAGEEAGDPGLPDTCPACGAQTQPPSPECPNCGLFLG